MTPADVLRRALLARVYDVAIKTPLDPAPRLSHRLGNDVWIKREDLQPVFSFKLRGAYERMRRLSESELQRGVICASAGNHAQGVALSAQKLRCRAVIVMPQTTPKIKVEAVVALGGEVVLFGDNYDEASAHAFALMEAEGLTFVHPYDDPDVIAGQATVGLEIVQHGEAPDAVFVAVGGGGLIAGVGSVIKSLYPDTLIIAVEPEDADAFSRSRQAGQRVTLDRVGRFADGVAVKKVGALSFELAQQVVDDVVLVSNDAICAAMKDMFEDLRAVLEPAGALAVAGLKQWVAQTGAKNQRLVAIACGANVNFDTLRHVSERAEIGERREAVLAVTIPERPGAFRAFCAIIGSRAVTEFNYRYAGPNEAHVFVGIRIDGPAESAALVEDLRTADYGVLDLTDNEMAKLHVRHMVGGRSDAIFDERLIAFSFPERAGALVEFLDAMQHPWNISLFHYRNHGSDYGRVLVGIQVPDRELSKLDEFLARLGYEWTDETENPAGRLFLR
jgi:threonine dehydratase